jgi:anti-sigma factor ChrR (cupin superfamily)
MELLNANFEQRMVLPTPRPGDWVPTPVPGVHRYRLDRIGGEVARATSIVRFEAGAQFTHHTDVGGEEFLVLEGTFSDEHGDYPAGTYVRKPPGMSHAPYSRDGCTLFIKVWQFCAGDTRPVLIDTLKEPWLPGPVPGVLVQPLHTFGDVSTALWRWEPDTSYAPHSHSGGEEILVLGGTLHDEHGEYAAGTWLRNPRSSRHTPRTAAEGALVYVKLGQLGPPILRAVPLHR